MKVYNQSAFIPDFPVCISSTSGNISLTLQDAKNLAEQLNKIIKNIENKSDAAKKGWETRRLKNNLKSKEI